MSETSFPTHTVFNQSSDYAGFNALHANPLLAKLCLSLPPEALQTIERFGLFCGSHEAQNLARLANTEIPSLRRFDEKGRRLELVDYHPAYHALMRRSVSEGLHASIWEGSSADGESRHSVRAAKFYLMAGVECGHLCPITMTSASVAALRSAPAILDDWLSLVATSQYDPSIKPAREKAGVTLGMGMTEKQGGSDVRANRTAAKRLPDGTYRLTGHKWFLSAPMSDAFLVIAQTGAGPTCFLMPRRLPDGNLNGIFVQRLKSKLGNRSNASAEVEFVEAFAERVGEEGRGVATILEMVTLTRLDCALASAGLMHGALGEAVHHARERSAFGEPLIEKPVMLRVLADMALDVAASTALVMRLANSFGRRDEDDADAAYARVMTPVAKYWICKLAPTLLAEAMECLGGNGYVEDGRLARAYREGPVNAIWEGSGNIMALDLLRAVKRDPDGFSAVTAQLGEDLGASGRQTVEVLNAARGMAEADEGMARIFIEQLALSAGAAALRRASSDAVADAFLETRLGGVFRQTYGMLDLRYDAKALVEALFPPIH